MNVHETLGHNPVVNPAAFALPHDQSRVAEDLEMMRDRGLRKAKRLLEITATGGAVRAGCEHRHNPETGWIAKSREGRGGLLGLFLIENTFEQRCATEFHCIDNSRYIDYCQYIEDHRCERS